MEFCVFLIVLWIIFIQLQLNKISKKIQNLNESFSSSRKVHNKTDEISQLENVNPETESDNESFERAYEESFEETNEETFEGVRKETNEELIKLYEDIMSDEKSGTNIIFLTFEKLFLGNIFNKIGAIALIIGIIIFIKLISPYIVFTPIMKTSVCYLTGILLLVFGFRMNENKMKAYKETLMGTGVSILFVTTYLACTYFELFESTLASIIATIILILVFAIADKQKTISMISIALIAGYINPILANRDVTTEFLFGYYIFLNLLSIVYVHRNPNKDKINFINLSLTFVILSILSLINTEKVSIIYPICLWVIYLLHDILRKNKSNSETDKNNILNWINFSVLTLFTMLFFKDKITNVGYVLLFVSIVYFALVYFNVKKSSQNYKPYLYSALVTVLLFTLFLFDGVTRIAFWSLECTTLILISLKYNLSYLNNWALGFLFASITAVLTTENVVFYKDMDEYTPILNIRTLCFSLPVIVSGISYLLFKKFDNKYAKEKEIFSFTFITLIFLYAAFELNSFIYKLNFETFDNDFMSQMLISIIGFKYALQAKRVYNTSNYQLFNVSSYLIALISLLTILIAGFSYKPIVSFYPVINVRFVAYLCAIFTSLLYVKWTKEEIYKYISIILGFILVHIETHDYIASLSSGSDIDWLLTFMWIIYAGTIILFGIFKNVRSLKCTGIIISILAISRIFIFDLAGKDLLYKFVAFLSLGIVLMIVSYFYNKKSN